MKINGGIMDGIPDVASKHSSSVWLKKRNPPFTEKEIEEIPGEELDGRLKKNLGYCMYLQVKNRDFKRMTVPD